MGQGSLRRGWSTAPTRTRTPATSPDVPQPSSASSLLLPRLVKAVEALLEHDDSLVASTAERCLEELQEAVGAPAAAAPAPASNGAAASGAPDCEVVDAHA